VGHRAGPWLPRDRHRRGALIEAGSDKAHAAPTYKHGFGFYPLLAYLDATGEALAGLLRPGNAGSGTGTDHLTVLDAALPSCRSTPPSGR
jgi:hypothetical protein